jgi:hypothetical protein
MRTLTDDVRELDESLRHHRASLRGYEAQGQMRLAEALRAKIDTLLEFRLMLTQGEP